MRGRLDILPSHRIEPPPARLRSARRATSPFQGEVEEVAPLSASAPSSRTAGNKIPTQEDWPTGGHFRGRRNGRHTGHARTADHRRRSLPARARRSRRRLFLLQHRHRLPADRGSLRPREQDQRQGTAAAAGAARKSRGRHGARRLSDERPSAGGDGAHHRRHRQHAQQPAQPGARPRAADPGRRPHADHREGLVRLAHAADPVGPGNVRPGRHAARDGEVGLRIARAFADQRRGGARGGSSDGASARAGLSAAAARALGRVDRADRAGAAAPAGSKPACRSCRARHACRLDRIGRAPAHSRRPAAGSRRAGAQRSCRALRHSGRRQQSAHGVPAVEPCHAFRLRAGRAADRRRSGHRAGERRAVDAASDASAGRLPRRAYRRGAVLRALSRCARSRATWPCRPASPRR